MTVSSGVIKEEALVLRSIRHGESSRIVTLFGAESGKIAVIAKGARRGKSGATGGAIVPGNYIEAIIHCKPSRSVQILGQVSVINDFSAVKGDLILSVYSSAVIEMLQRCVGDDEPNKKLLAIALESLNNMNSLKQDPKIVFLKYLLGVLSTIGFELDPFTCPVCDSNPAEIGLDNILWMEAGAICCHSCHPQAGNTIKLTGEFVRLLRFLSDGNSPALTRLKLSQSARKNLVGILEKFLRFHHPGLGSLPALQMLHRFEEPVTTKIPDKICPEIHAGALNE